MEKSEGTGPACQVGKTRCGQLRPHRDARCGGGATPRASRRSHRPHRALAAHGPRDAPTQTCPESVSRRHRPGGLQGPGGFGDSRSRLLSHGRATTGDLGDMVDVVGEGRGGGGGGGLRQPLAALVCDRCGPCGWSSLEASKIFCRVSGRRLGYVGSARVETRLVSCSARSWGIFTACIRRTYPWCHSSGPAMPSGLS